MTDIERRTAAARFAADRKGQGAKKQETHVFWLALLQKVYGVDVPEKYVSFVPDANCKSMRIIRRAAPRAALLILTKNKNTGYPGALHRAAC